MRTAAWLTLFVLSVFLRFSTVGAQQPVIVDMREYSFQPRDTRITVGTAVQWINHDDVPHSIAMEGGRPGSSGPIAPGRDYTFSFREAGRFTYRCAIHPTMLGVVTVDSP